MHIERSGYIPLEVRIHIHAFPSLSPHIERISSLEMFIHHELSLHIITRSISKPAPLLETMTMHVRGQSSLKIPPIFFEAFLFSVRMLNVRGVTLAPGPCTLSQLTRFTRETRLNRSATPEAKLNCPGRQDHESKKHVTALSHLEEVTLTADEGFRAPLASPIIPAPCLSSVRRVNTINDNKQTVSITYYESQC